MDMDVTPPTAARIADDPVDIPSSAGSGRVIAITGTEPELGISSFALALAEGFAHAGRATLIIDANPERGGLLERLPETGISRVSVEHLCDEFPQLTFPDGLLPYLGHTSEGAAVLGSDDERPLALSDDQLLYLIGEVRRHWSTVIVDCGPRHAGRVGRVARVATLITLAPNRFKGEVRGTVIRTGGPAWPRDRRMARRRPVVWDSLGARTRRGIVDLVTTLDGAAAEAAIAVERMLTAPAPQWQRRVRRVMAVAPVIALLAVGAAASRDLPMIGAADSSDAATEHTRAGRSVPAVALPFDRHAPPRSAASRSSPRPPAAVEPPRRPATTPEPPRSARERVREATRAPRATRRVIPAPRASGSAVAEFSP